MRKLMTGVLGLALGAAAVAGLLALRQVQIPGVPWHSEEAPAPPGWPLLVESPHRAEVDLERGWRGGVIQGENWLANRRSSRFAPWSLEHWAAREPSLYFVSDGAEDLELALELGPRRGGGASELVRPVLNGGELAELDLADAQAELVVELPRSLLQRGINVVRLVFMQAEVEQVAGAALHPEQGVASFRSISLRRPGVAASKVGPDRMRLHTGSPVALPFSAAASARLELRARSMPAGSRLRASCGAPGHPDEMVLWEGSLSAGEELAVPRPPAELATLWLELLASPQDAAELAYDWVELDLPSRPAAAKRRPNIFVYVVDTLRADAIRRAARKSSETPHFAAFARDAVVFERAWSPSSWTRPSTMALLTGVYPGQAPEAADGSPWWLPEALGRRGYETLAVSQSFVVSERRFGRGFASYYTSDALSRGTDEGQMPEWFLWHHLVSRQKPQRPLFAYIHTVDPHGPYTPYDEDRRGLPWWVAWRPHHYGPSVVERDGRQGEPRTLEIMRALYAGDVRHADRSFGSFVALLKYAGLYDDSVIFLLSDHGEAFGEHGTVSHGKTLHEEVLHVPLMVKLARGERAGTEIRRRVSTVSVAATALDLAGLPPAPHLAALSLLAEQDETPLVRAHLTRKPRDPQHRLVLDAVVSGSRKCIASLSAGGQRRLEIFDLDDDPLEQRPLDDAGLRAWCLELLAPAFEAQTEGANEMLESEETRRRLEALGYIDNV